jgi:hypothetical protein
MGTYAGDADAQPTGTFATIDRETVTIPGGMREVRDIGHRRLRALLAEAGVDAEAADRDARALHEGRVLVLVRDGGDLAGLDRSAASAPSAGA